MNQIHYEKVFGIILIICRIRHIIIIKRIMYEIILYDTEDGRCPVQELLDSLDPKLLAKTLRTIDLLEMNGPLLREPY